MIASITHPTTGGPARTATTSAPIATPNLILRALAFFAARISAARLDASPAADCWGMRCAIAWPSVAVGAVGVGVAAVGDEATGSPVGLGGVPAVGNDGEVCVSGTTGVEISTVRRYGTADGSVEPSSGAGPGALSRGDGLAGSEGGGIAGIPGGGVGRWVGAVPPSRGTSPSRRNDVLGGASTGDSLMATPSARRTGSLSHVAVMSWHDGFMSESTGTIKDRLQADLTVAMKARDEITTSTIRMLRSAITNAEVAGNEAVELTDDQVIAVLQTEAKKRVESAEVYEQNGRTESAAKERAELAVIDRYLPAAMSDEELATIVDEEIAAAAAAGAEGGKAMGSVIKAVRERAGASADGGRIAALVKSKLTS